jgi:hypothetical protein
MGLFIEMATTSSSLAYKVYRMLYNMTKFLSNNFIYLIFLPSSVLSAIDLFGDRLCQTSNGTSNRQGWIFKLDGAQIPLRRPTSVARQYRIG